MRKLAVTYTIPSQVKLSMKQRGGDLGIHRSRELILFSLTFCDFSLLLLENTSVILSSGQKGCKVKQAKGKRQSFWETLRDKPENVMC